MREKDKTTDNQKYIVGSRKTIRPSKFKSFCAESKRVEMLFPSEQEAKKIAPRRNVSEETERYYYCITCKGWHLAHLADTKPKRSRFFCYDSRKNKILFQSRKEAERFIKFNSLDIEEETGIKPDRVYYCVVCVGWHLASTKDDIRTERVTEQVEAATVAETKQEKKEENTAIKDIISLDSVELKISILEKNTDIWDEQGSLVALKRILIEYSILQYSIEGSKTRKKNLGRRIGALKSKLNWAQNKSKIRHRKEIITLASVEKRLTRLEEQYLSRSKKALKTIISQFGVLVETQGYTKEISSIAKRINVLEREINSSHIFSDEKIRKGKKGIKKEIITLSEAIEVSIAFLEAEKTNYTMDDVAFIFGHLAALSEKIAAYSRKMRYEYLEEEVAECLLFQKQRKELGKRLQMILPEKLLRQEIWQDKEECLYL